MNIINKRKKNSQAKLSRCTISQNERSEPTNVGRCTTRRTCAALILNGEKKTITITDRNS